MQHQFENLRKSRLLQLKLIDGLSIDQLNAIPDGFKNNIAWNIGHLVVTQQLLCYKNSGLPCKVSDEMIELYKKGSVPSVPVTSEEFEKIKTLFIDVVSQFEADYNAGVFKNYTSYTTSVNITLTDIDTAIDFNSFHEGIHLGVLLAIRKLVK
ncbi:MAG: DinB family protein [Flavicella sp.]